MIPGTKVGLQRLRIPVFLNMPEHLSKIEPLALAHFYHFHTSHIHLSPCAHLLLNFCHHGAQDNKPDSLVQKQIP